MSRSSRSFGAARMMPDRHGSTEYEYKVLTFDRDMPRHEARKIVNEHVEYGRWELARTVAYERGIRRMWLRRKIIRVQRTA